MIFSGRMLTGPELPTSRCAASPSSRFEVPTKPATNGVDGSS